MIEDVLAQPDSLHRVWERHAGTGRTALLQASAAVRSSRLVILTGMGASLYASIPLQCALAEAGIRAFVVEAGELLHYQPQLCADATLILISQSGETVEVVKLLLRLRDLARTTIGVSTRPESTLGRSAGIFLEVQSLPDRMVAIQSYTGTLLTLGLLGCACAGADIPDGAAHDFLGAISAAIGHSVDASHGWSDFLDGAAPIHMLARGPAWGSALEAALLFNETAKHPACALLAGSFRHGPVEVVDDSFRAVIFASGDPTRRLELALAADLARFGAEVRIVGPAEAGEVLPCPSWKSAAAPKFLSAIGDIIPMQCAAVRLAEQNGVDAGRFRYAPQVTSDEMHFPDLR